jgi:WbqC-like protein family
MTETLVSVHQPNFMPWLKLLDKILASDVYVAYDTAQFTKTEYHARQKVKTPSKPVWMSVPVLSTGEYQPIMDVEIDTKQPYGRQHLHRLRTAYGSTPYFDEVYSLVKGVYSGDHERLVDLNLDLIEALCSYLDSPVRIIRASTLPHEGDRAERLIQLVKGAGGTDHLTSTYGGDHQDVDWSRFERDSIGLRVQQFEHPEYDQIGADFVPNLAAIDMLFICGRQTGDMLARRRSLVPVGSALQDVTPG